MEIKDLKANQGKIDIVADVLSKDAPRTFEKFGKTGKVCNCRLSDETGEVVLTLWNDDIDKVDIGDKVHVLNGWCSEYKGEKQLSAGKYGKIEVVQSTGKVLTNDPALLAQQAGMAEAGGTGEEGAGEEEAGEESVEEEDIE